MVECLPDPRPSVLELEEPPEAQYVTRAGNRIDLLLNGSGWVIALDNKLEHGLDNPFAEYRASVQGTFAGKQKHFVILSPYDPHPQVADWTWIDYRLLLGKVRDKLGARFITSGVSKWGIFLREFLINIEHQLGRDMDKQEFDFVRNNYEAIANVVTLHERYIERLEEMVRDAARETLGTDPASVKQENWEERRTALRVFPRQDRKHNATLVVLPDGTFRKDMRRPNDADRSDFTRGGMFSKWPDESKGSLWVFVKDEKDLKPALGTLKLSLSLLQENTQ